MSIQAWDIWLIQFLQRSGDWVTPIMEFFTALGYPQAYMIIIATIYWSLDRKMGLRMAIFLPLVSSLNSILKQAIHAPRPYWVSTNIKAIHASNGFGMPSGHAQAATVWLLVSSYLRRKWIWIIAILVTFLIGLSRSYLGVHFPSQVIVGWVIGICVVICFIRFETAVAVWIRKLKIYWQLLLVSGTAALIILTGSVIIFLAKNWEIPQVWIQNASPYLTIDGATIQSSIGMIAVVSNAGAFLGAATGGILIMHRGGFDHRGSWWKRLLRCILGLACIFGLYLAFQSIAPEESEQLLYATWRFFGFAFILFTEIFLLPVVFLRTRLCDARKKDQKLTR
jgi:membrane-associated phospholipid phosphatase